MRVVLRTQGVIQYSCMKLVPIIEFLELQVILPGMDCDLGVVCRQNRSMFGNSKSDFKSIKYFNMAIADE